MTDIRDSQLINNLQLKLSEAERAVRDLKSEKAELEAQVTHYYKQISWHQEHKQELERQLTEAQEENAEHMNDAIQDGQAVKRLVDLNASLTERVSQLEEKLKVHRERHNLAGDENAALKKELSNRCVDARGYAIELGQMADRMEKYHAEEIQKEESRQANSLEVSAKNYQKLVQPEHDWDAGGRGRHCLKCGVTESLKLPFMGGWRESPKTTGETTSGVTTTAQDYCPRCNAWLGTNGKCREQCTQATQVCEHPEPYMSERNLPYCRTCGARLTLQLYQRLTTTSNVSEGDKK